MFLRNLKKNTQKNRNCFWKCDFSLFSFLTNREDKFNTFSTYLNHHNSQLCPYLTNFVYLRVFEILDESLEFATPCINNAELFAFLHRILGAVYIWCNVRFQRTMQYFNLFNVDIFANCWRARFEHLIRDALQPIRCRFFLEI